MIHNEGDHINFVKADPKEWAEALTNYQAVKAAEAAGDTSVAILVWEAATRLLHMPAPDVEALRIKLEMLWGSQLWDDDDDGHARRMMIGDLRRFEYFVHHGWPSASDQSSQTLEKEKDDRFWGHLGLKFPGDEKTRWWPITGSVRSAFYSLPNADWIAVPTLANRLLIFRVACVEHLCLLDDASSPPDDFDLQGAPYAGWPPSHYRALSNWAKSQLGHEESCSSELEQEIEGFLESTGLRDNPEQVLALVEHTRITLNGGATRSYHAEPKHLNLLFDHFGGEFCTLVDQMSWVILGKSGGDLEIYYPTNALVMVDLPFTEIEADD